MLAVLRRFRTTPRGLGLNDRVTESLTGPERATVHSLLNEAASPSIDVWARPWTATDPEGILAEIVAQERETVPTLVAQVAEHIKEDLVDCERERLRDEMRRRTYHWPGLSDV